MQINGTIIGYDPGGNDSHGLARLFFNNSLIAEAITETLIDSEQVIRVIENESSLLAVGVDTLTYWSTGRSGWRPADLWLRTRYREVQNSIVNPNNLKGAMALNGMAVLCALRTKRPDIFITETHPKILFWSMTRTRHDYKNNQSLMKEKLIACLGIDILPNNEHEWDAAISAFAALQGLTERWKRDLHEIPCTAGERLITPCGKTHYFWPD